jgi:hypothetical protein
MFDNGRTNFMFLSLQMKACADTLEAYIGGLYVEQVFITRFKKVCLLPCVCIWNLCKRRSHIAV